jgi:hypothetical protein
MKEIQSSADLKLTGNQKGNAASQWSAEEDWIWYSFVSIMLADKREDRRSRAVISFLNVCDEPQLHADAHMKGERKCN